MAVPVFGCNYIFSMEVVKMTYLQKLTDSFYIPSILKIVKQNCPTDFFDMIITLDQCEGQPSCHTCWKQTYKGESLKV